MARGDGVCEEEEQNGRTENDRNESAAPYVPRDHVQDPSPMIILSSDEEEEEDDESDREGELPPESSTVSSANLKLVYDVEYRAPN